MVNMLKFLPLALLVATSTVQAQNCPPGIPSAGNPACIPPDRSNSPYYQEGGAPLSRRSRWHLTWGAIATDSMTGDIGVTADEMTKHAAERKALSRCRTYGASKCKVAATFTNQCAAMAWPSDKGTPSNGGTAMTAKAPTLEIARADALSGCSQKNGGECMLLYSECSEPVLVEE